MSQVLDLAGRLRALSDDELVRLLRLRGGSSSNLKDFFDLADWLLQPKNMTNYVNSLSRSALAFASGVSDGPSNPVLEFLRAEGKVSFDDVATAPTKKPDLAKPSDSTAAIHAFECIAGISELIFDLEHRIIKEVGKQGIGLADAKRLAALTGREIDFVRAYFELAAATGLIVAIDSRWTLTTRASDWTSMSAGDRWQLLATTWLELLGSSASGELNRALDQGMNLTESLHFCFPLERFETTSRFGHVLTYAELLGISVAGVASAWASDLLAGNVAKAGARVAAAMPTTQSRIIIQGDLSVIAPGPLSTDDERALRVFVETEQAGLASRYRLSALSISFGMESGLSVDQMRQTLKRLSGVDLPQPVEYLLNEAGARFGRIRVIEDPRTGGSYVTSTDTTLLTELANDSRLKPYALIRLDSEYLSSRFGRDILYFGLREIGHSAIRTDKAGTPISPLRFVPNAELKTESGDWVQTVQRLRESDHNVTSNSDDDAVMRQILLAIKTKAKIEVKFVGQDAREMVLILEPSGVANGRMRARDRKADIERTIPLDNISAVSFI